MASFLKANLVCIFISCGLNVLPPVATAQADTSAIWGSMFQRQVEKCWKKPYGGVASQRPEAVFAIRLRRDGTLEGDPVPERAPATPFLKVYQEAAYRAIIECQPYKLPEAMYEEWKYFAPVFKESAEGRSSDRGSVTGQTSDSTTNSESRDFTEVYRATFDGKWSMIGRIPTMPDVTYRQGRASCLATARSADGSELHVIKDLDNGEIYFWVINTDWTLVEDDNKKNVQVNFYMGGRFTDGISLEWIVRDKMTIHVQPFPSVKEVTAALYGSDNIRLVMPGNIQNFVFSLPNASKLFAAFEKCIDNHKALTFRPGEKGKI